MIDKFLKLTIHESIFQVRILSVLILLGIVLAQAGMNRFQVRQYAKLRQEKTLVERIPEMERKTGMFRPATTADVPTMSKSMVLQGTSIKNNIAYALINGSIYQKGDRLGDYQVIKIQRGRVILENIVTKGQRNLWLLESF